MLKGSCTVIFTSFLMPVGGAAILFVSDYIYSWGQNPLCLRPYGYGGGGGSPLLLTKDLLLYHIGPVHDGGWQSLCMMRGR